MARKSATGIVVFTARARKGSSSSAGKPAVAVVQDRYPRMIIKRGNTNMTSASLWRRWLGRTFLPVVLALPGGHLVAFRAYAAEQAPGVVAPQHQPRRQGSRPTLDERVSKFARSLDLNEAQQDAVKKILEQQQQEILQIRRDPSAVGRVGIDRFRSLQERTVERIRAVLNEEQKKKYDPLAPRRIPQTPEQPSVEDWLKVTT